MVEEDVVVWDDVELVAMLEVVELDDLVVVWDVDELEVVPAARART